LDRIRAQQLEESSKLNLRKVLVIGSGGREHAIVSKVVLNRTVEQVFIAPGNAGTQNESPICKNVPIAADNVRGLIDFAVQEKIDLVLVGPEQPLVDGLVDELSALGIPAFGPTRAAAEIEASKAWCKDFLARNNLRTARYRNFTTFEDAKAYIESLDYPVVVKASGLAAGKGVLIPTSKEEAIEGAKSILSEGVFGSAGNEIVIEEFLVGDEVSVLAFSDGESIVAMPAAQDHKRVFDNDQGLNTGGMGAYAPTPVISPATYKQCVEIIQVYICLLSF
jgi:phosphoribosylamine--glycine ligase / phosphoribosylformylglycinamidine cyclo-ligase